MKIIVAAQVEKQEKGKPPFHTLCAQCSEDPRFCGEPI